MKNYTFRFRNDDTNKVEQVHNFRDKEITEVQFDRNYGLEQFTGLNDIHGTMIFENDVVQMSRFSSEDGVDVSSVGIVKYLAPSFVLYYPSTSSRLNFSEVINSNSNNLLVVGDISHPDLINLLK